MKVYLIHPKAPPTIESLSEGLAWWGVDANTAPLEPALLSALTPAEVELKIADQQAGDPINFEESADLVVFTARPDQVPGLRYLSGRFRARQVPIVLAGPYVTDHPDRVDFADIKLRGALETVWPALLQDRLAGRTEQREYLSLEPFDLARSPLPRWDVLRLRRYRMAVVEVARATASAADVRYKPVDRVREELELLMAHDVKHVRLEAPDLLSDPTQALALLESLAALNSGRRRKLRFEARVAMTHVRHAGLVEALSRANVRRVEVELNPPELDPMHPHEDPREAIETVLRLLEQGIRVAGRLIVFREGDDAHAWEAQTAIARESLATPWVRAARALPGTKVHDALRQAGRLIQGGRDAELRIELFDAPNFHPAEGSREDQLARLKALILERFSPTAIERRVAGLFAETQRTPAGDVWPAREDLRALARMMGGTLRNPGEQRIRQVARAAGLVVTCRPPVSLWNQGLELVLEEAAIRSYVCKMAEERPLDAAVPSMTWKQRAVGVGAKLVGVVAARRM